MHHKYLIVDQGITGNDPLVLTGSHNWSTSATSRNDENTLIIHDEDFANQFYQEFVDMMNDNGIAVGNENINSISELIIYPNPGIDLITIHFNSENQEVLSYQLTDITGKPIINNFIQTTTGENNFSVSLNDLRSGIYLLHMQSKTGNAVQKIIKH